MEGIFFILIGAALFAHSWYLLGLYTDGRTMGLIAGGLTVGLAAAAAGAAAGTFEPALIPLEVNGVTNPVVTALQVYITLWAVYTGAVAAHGLWGFEERAIGFHALFLSVVSIVYLVLIPTQFTTAQVSDNSAAALGTGAVILGALGGLLFFHLAVPFREMRTVTGWFMLAGSILVSLLGLGILFGLVEPGSVSLK